jgi:hypothetical protein
MLWIKYKSGSKKIHLSLYLKAPYSLGIKHFVIKIKTLG